MTQEELAQQLVDLKDQNDKANGEIAAKIVTLEAAITNAGTVSPAVEAALADLKTSVQTSDDFVADATGVDGSVGTDAHDAASTAEQV